MTFTIFEGKSTVCSAQTSIDENQDKDKVVVHRYLPLDFQIDYIYYKITSLLRFRFSSGAIKLCGSNVET